MSISKNIKNNKYYLSTEESGDSFSPACIVKFFTYIQKDTVRNTDKVTDNPLDVGQITVVSDIINVSVQSQKGSFLGVAEITLSSGDINYLNLLVPGDHAMIWMMKDRITYDRMKTKIFNNNPSNDFNSGLKFVGKVNSIRAVYSMGSDGQKILRYVVTLKSFSELTSSVYYNRMLQNRSLSFQSDVSGSTAQDLNILEDIGGRWEQIIPRYGKEQFSNIDSIIKWFIQVFLGTGVKGAVKQAKAGDDSFGGEMYASSNLVFRIPSPVAQIMGIKNTNKTQYQYADLLNSITGIQTYNKGSPNLFYPEINNKLRGDLVSIPDNFSDTTVESLIKAHLNLPFNEAYTTLRVDKNFNILPTFIARQIPFTTDFLSKKSGYTVPLTTPFSSLPRWVIPANKAMLNYNIGTTDVARTNFVQVYGQFYGGNQEDPALVQAMQIVEGNLDIDAKDIQRNGSRNMLISTNVDLTTSGKVTPKFLTALISDFFFNQHLKLNGTITSSGIQEPIAVGDNLEFDGNIFHIESVAHQYSVNADGSKSFITQLQLSNGMSTSGHYPTVATSQSRANLRGSFVPGITDMEVTVNSNGDKLIQSGGNSGSSSESNNGLSLGTSLISNIKDTVNNIENSIKTDINMFTGTKKR